MECITFGDDFNQRIQPNILPKSVKSITFGWNFNQRIKPNILPKSVKSITFGHDFNQEIKQNVLPHSLTHLNTYGNRMINIPYDNKRFLLWCPPLGIDNITHKNNMNKISWESYHLEIRIKRNLIYILLNY